MMNFLSKITRTQWIIIAIIIVLIVIIILVAQNAKKKGELAANKNPNIVLNPYQITPYTPVA